MRRNGIWAAGLLTCLPGLAMAADGCPPEGLPAVPTFETAKAQFLTGDYKAFLDTASAYIPDAASKYDSLFGQLAKALPNGFDHCLTVVQRRDPPGLVQEVVFYYPPGLDAPLSLYLMGAEVDGTVKILEFTYDTTLGNVMDKLR